jgi:GNAT superfamily N-acetyltransferase
LIWHKDEFFISTDVQLLDLKLITRFIAEESYWGKGRTESVMRKAIENSAICFGLYLKSEHKNEQVGFARVISDLALFGYLSDVFVLSGYRGKGLGKWLVETVCSHPELCNLKRMTLMTRTPEFYEPLAFAIHPASDPRKFMIKTPYS